MKKYIVIWGSIFSTLLILAIIHFMPIRFESGGCSGGYNSHIIEKYKNNLYQTFASNENLQKDDYKLVSTLEEIKSSATIIDARGMTVKIKYRVGDELFKVTYKGKKVWIEKYRWTILETNPTSL